LVVRLGQQHARPARSAKFITADILAISAAKSRLESQPQQSSRYSAGHRKQQRNRLFDAMERAHHVQTGRP
jgi:hypothetical protein